MMRSRRTKCSAPQRLIACETPRTASVVFDGESCRGPRPMAEPGAFRWRHYAENSRLLYGARQHCASMVNSQVSLMSLNSTAGLPGERTSIPFGDQIVEVFIFGRAHGFKSDTSMMSRGTLANAWRRRS